MNGTLEFAYIGQLDLFVTSFEWIPVAHAQPILVTAHSALPVVRATLSACQLRQRIARPGLR